MRNDHQGPPPYDEQRQQHSADFYEPPPDFRRGPSARFYQYPPNASYPPCNYGYPPLQAQQQQQQMQQRQQCVVIVTSQQLQIDDDEAVSSFNTHKTVACISFWLFGAIIGGGIGYILALVAESAASDGDESTARHLGRASLSVSIIGMVISIIIVSAGLGAMH